MPKLQYKPDKIPAEISTAADEQLQPAGWTLQALLEAYHQQRVERYRPKRRGVQGKISRLPQELRERIDAMLADESVSFGEIIDALEAELPEGVQINKDNLSHRWQSVIEPALRSQQEFMQALKGSQELLDAEDSIDVSRVLADRLKQMLLQLEMAIQKEISAAQLAGDFLPDEDLLARVKSLVSSAQKLESASKITQERAQKIREQARKEAVKGTKKQAARQVEQVCAQQGLGTEAKEAILRGIFGI